MLRERDQRVIDFIEEFNCANTSQLKQLFFDDIEIRYCQKRLKCLCDMDYIYRNRQGINNDYVYYYDKSNKPKQIEHNNIRVNFYINAVNGLNLQCFIPEFKVGFGKGKNEIRPDAYMEFEWCSKVYGVFLEIQLSHGFNQDKYEAYYRSGEWREKLGGFPLIVVVSNRNLYLDKSNLKYIQMGTECNMNELIEGINYNSDKEVYRCV